MTSISVQSPCSIVSGLREISADYDLLLCDVWGVVHDGRQAFAATNEALTRFRQGGGTVVLLTNAPRPSRSVLAQLDGLGVARSAFDDIVTSGDATVALIAERGDMPFFHVGPMRDRALFEEVRAKTGIEPALAELSEARFVVLTGLFDDTTETPDDYADLYAAMHGRGLDMICANPDAVVHVGDRLIYCGGALAERYESGGGAVLYAGKPHAPIYQVAIGAAEAKRGRPIERSRMLAVGDGLRTDIAGARNQGLASLFVTSGIHRDETLVPETGEIDPSGLAALLRQVDQHPAAAIAQLVW